MVRQGLVSFELVPFVGEEEGSLCRFIPFTNDSAECNHRGSMLRQACCLRVCFSESSSEVFIASPHRSHALMVLAILLFYLNRPSLAAVGRWLLGDRHHRRISKAVWTASRDGLGRGNAEGWCGSIFSSSSMEGRRNQVTSYIPAVASM